MARHSTIDLTMNVYMHVDMGDLASGVENLPALPSHAAFSPKVTNAAPATPAKPANDPTIPSELASLAGNWSALPHHIRQAIATLAGA